MKQTGCGFTDPPVEKEEPIVLDGALKIIHWDSKQWSIEDRSKIFAIVFSSEDDAELIMTALAVKHGDTEVIS